MKKLFASVPMKGRTEEEIRESFAKMKRIAEAYEGEELELIDTWIAEDPPEGVRENAVWYLGKSLELLSTADVYIGVGTYGYFPGCCVKEEVAQLYKIKHYHVDATDIIPNWNELMQRLSALERPTLGL
jgi:hypothetical protein|uniref:Blasticidin M n=1 Tax=Phage sp. ctXnn1 TaxID=2826749 RepID=A0A8S5NA46_9VIRU|nr:MAG TPA: Blasticidin M [Phage sp. ctXnn1]